MLKKFLPKRYVKDVFQIKPDMLKEQGIKGIITDLDNTLVAWDVADATGEIVEWISMLQEAGIQVTIISNNNEERVRVFSEPIKVPFEAAARKPSTKAFRRASKRMQLEPHEVAVVGDQLLTDVLGGNRGGFHTILVVPIVQTDAKVTRFNRAIERRILNHFYKKGYLEKGAEE